jgi:hypothetical protein
MNKTIYSIIICYFCIFTCKPKESEKFKEEGNMDKPLNLSLLVSGPGASVSYDTIDGNVIKTLLYPYSINIVNDSIMIFAGWVVRDEKAGFIDRDEEYKGKLTDEQHLKIKNMVSALNLEYEIFSERRRLYDGRTCVLEIDNQVRYEQRACASNPEFSRPPFSPMPKEILLLFQYIVGLSPIKIM